jgi:hypothetical protein
MQELILAAEPTDIWKMEPDIGDFVLKFRQVEHGIA